MPSFQDLMDPGLCEDAAPSIWALGNPTLGLRAGLSSRPLPQHSCRLPGSPSPDPTAGLGMASPPPRPPSPWWGRLSLCQDPQRIPGPGPQFTRQDISWVHRTPPLPTSRHRKGSENAASRSLSPPERLRFTRLPEPTSAESSRGKASGRPGRAPQLLGISFVEGRACSCPEGMGLECAPPPRWPPSGSESPAKPRVTSRSDASPGSASGVTVLVVHPPNRPGHSAPLHRQGS